MYSCLQVKEFCKTLSRKSEKLTIKKFLKLKNDNTAIFKYY